MKERDLIPFFHARGVQEPVVCDDSRPTVFLRRCIIGALAALLLLTGPPVASAKSWADDAIRAVVDVGILPGETVEGFDPTRPLDHGTLSMLVWGAIPASIDRVTIPTTAEAVTIGELDAVFVAALGLRDTAAAARAGLASAGYEPRADAGTEVIARSLGLRYNHPAGSDRLERSATEIATRADAAWTTAKVLRGVDPSYAASIAARLAALPATTGARHAALQRAVAQIGQPYVWGGTTEGKQPQGHGGFDCSGFIWRVMILDPAAPPGTARRIGGRTTFEMARTTSRPRRLGRGRVRPGDILLFGSAGRRSKVAQIGHSGIDLGGGLMIHSSSQGVAIKEWNRGWHATSFAFGKAVLPG